MNHLQDIKTLRYLDGMIDKILHLDTIKKSRARALAKPNFLKLRFSAVDEESKRIKESEEQERKEQEQEYEEKLQTYMEDNFCSREDAINRIGEQDKQLRIRYGYVEEHEKEMRKQLGAYAAAGFDECHTLGIRYRSEVYGLLSYIKGEWEGRISDDPKDWVFHSLKWDLDYQIDALETLRTELTNRIDTLNHNKNSDPL